VQPRALTRKAASTLLFPSSKHLCPVLTVLLLQEAEAVDDDPTGVSTLLAVTVGKCCGRDSREIPLVRESKTNPGRFFDEAKLAELAAFVR
jgi:hypothetical protein